MRPVLWTIPIFGLFLSISAACADEPAVPDPLFQDQHVLEVQLSAPLTTILAERSSDVEFPGLLQYSDDDGRRIDLDINIRARGRFRRDQGNCRFPPLRLNFKNSQTKNTLFHKQDKVKLVTHCRNSPRYAQAVLSEFVAYKILNAMTEISFNVRLLKITYSDSDAKRDDEVQYAFIIEHKDRLAKRIGKSVLDIPRTSSKSLDPAFMNMISVYHYLIGNTDYSQIRAAEGEMCCHNHVLLANEGEKVWSVPYDFDQSGLVNAPYATPAAQLDLRRVTQRLYRGRCFNNTHLEQTLNAFRNKKAEILAATKIEALSESSSNVMTKYIERFFETLDSERRIKRAFLDSCL